MVSSITRQKVVQYGSYTGLFLSCFSFFCYWTFPYDRLRDVIVQRVAAEASSGKGPPQLKIGTLGPAFPLGVALTDVAFAPADADAVLGAHLDSLTLKPSLLSLMLGNVNVRFSGEAGNGEVDGQASQDGAERDVELELDNADVQKLGLGAWLGLPVTGDATGTVQLHLSEKPPDSTGAIELEVSAFTLGDGKSQLKLPGMAGGFTIEKINAGTLKIKAEVKDGVVKLDSITAKGKDIEINGSGTVRIGATWLRSRVDLDVDIQFTDAYRSRNDRTKALFELMGMQLSPTAAQGTLHFEVTGSLASMRTRQGASPGAAAKKRKLKASTAGSKSEP